MDTFNPMQKAKRLMFAMRNGIVADALRKGGSPFRIIFGVNIPQLRDIAQQLGQNAALAQQLWLNNTTRESMLIAPMLMPATEFSEDMAREWIAQIPAPEVADMLCLRLLRQQPYAIPLAQSLAQSESPISRYTGLRLMCNFVEDHPSIAEAMATSELQRQEPLTRMVATQLLDASNPV